MQVKGLKTLFGYSLVYAGVILGLCAEAVSSELKLDGNIAQGGLVLGKTDPAAIVTIDGRGVRVSQDGVFLIGFGRDDAGEVTLRVQFPDGASETRKLAIAQRSYDIQRIDGLPPQKVTPPKMDWERIRKEAALIKDARRSDSRRTDFLTGFQWPLKGRISGVYGSQRILNGKPKRPHYGVDIAAPVGTVAVAPADGVVSLTHPDMFYSGGTLIIDHGHGLSSSFLHLNRILVEQGKRVKKGEPLAEVGATGRVTGPHLDWRMNLFNKRLDPQLLVD